MTTEAMTEDVFIDHIRSVIAPNAPTFHPNKKVTDESHAEQTADIDNSNKKSQEQ